MSDDLTVPAGTPVPDFRQEACPHCHELFGESRTDEHVATVHADLPPCTATIDNKGAGAHACVFRAGHASGEYGDWHASARDSPAGRTIWNDNAEGATPHRVQQGAAADADPDLNVGTRGDYPHWVIETRLGGIPVCAWRTPYPEDARKRLGVLRAVHPELTFSAVRQITTRTEEAW